MTSRFQPFSPSYQNISNRLSRLKHHSKNHHSSVNIVTNSIPKPINVFVVDSVNTSKRRLSPTILTFNDQNYPNDRFTGRVAKNVGLKKYNQRHLKQVLDCKIPAGLRTEGNSCEPVESRCHLKIASSRQDWKNRSPKNWKFEMTDEVKVNQHEFKQNNTKTIFQQLLVPGKMYSKQYLNNLVK